MKAKKLIEILLNHLEPSAEIEIAVKTNDLELNPKILDALYRDGKFIIEIGNRDGNND